MDTGCPSLLMPLPHPSPPRNRPCPVLTLEIAHHLETGVGRAPVLTNVAGAIDLREILHSPGVTVAARGLLLDPDVPRGTDILEMLHPGGETQTPTTNDLLCEGFIFPVGVQQKDILSCILQVILSKGV